VEKTCYCPLDGVINALSRKYAMQVVNAIGAHGTMRFGELEDRVSTASSATVSERLQELVDAGLVERAQHDEIPPRVEYELTEDATNSANCSRRSSSGRPTASR
jgi:DNA-binding HxlR family transcriptional regulator